MAGMRVGEEDEDLRGRTLLVGAYSVHVSTPHLQESIQHVLATYLRAWLYVLLFMDPFR